MEAKSEQKKTMTAGCWTLHYCASNVGRTRLGVQQVENFSAKTDAQIGVKSEAKNLGSMSMQRGT